MFPCGSSRASNHWRCLPMCSTVINVPAENLKKQATRRAMTVFSLLYSRRCNHRVTHRCLAVCMFCFLKCSYFLKVPSKCQEVPGETRWRCRGTKPNLLVFEYTRAKDLAVPLDAAASGIETKSFCLISWALNSHPVSTHYGYTKTEVNTD